MHIFFTRWFKKWDINHGDQRILTFEGSGEEPITRFCIFKSIGYRTAEMERKPKNALKFYSVEGSSVYEMRVNQNERQTKKQIGFKDTFPK